MGEYRCLNCGHTTSDVNISANLCEKSGCGFRVGRYEFDNELDYSPRYPPLTEEQRKSKLEKAQFWIPYAIITYAIMSIGRVGHFLIPSVIGHALGFFAPLIAAVEIFDRKLTANDTGISVIFEPAIALVGLFILYFICASLPS